MCLISDSTRTAHTTRVMNIRVTELLSIEVSSLLLKEKEPGWLGLGVGSNPKNAQNVLSSSVSALYEGGIL